MVLVCVCVCVCVCFLADHGSCTSQHEVIMGSSICIPSMHSLDLIHPLLSGGAREGRKRRPQGAPDVPDAHAESTLC